MVKGLSTSDFLVADSFYKLLSISNIKFICCWGHFLPTHLERNLCMPPNALETNLIALGRKEEIKEKRLQLMFELLTAYEVPLL